MKSKAFHFNFVDILLICITVLILTVLLYLYVIGNSNYDLSSRDSVQVTVTVEGIPYAQKDKIHRNDKVYLQSTQQEFGTVKSVSYENMPHIDESSGTVDYYYPELSNAEIVIECVASAYENSIEIGGCSYSVSDIIEFFAPGFSGSGTIASFEVIE